uniref:Uncharacterized protein n=1 Tax=Rhizophora mucronata TaxID=61149 RepID=A0A2P2MDG6_RHIMU
MVKYIYICLHMYIDMGLYASVDVCKRSVLSSRIL